MHIRQMLSPHDELVAYAASHAGVYLEFHGEHVNLLQQRGPSSPISRANHESAVRHPCGSYFSNSTAGVVAAIVGLMSWLL
jgi:hypothetical protein